MRHRVHKLMPGVTLGVASLLDDGGFVPFAGDGAECGQDGGVHGLTRPQVRTRTDIVGFAEDSTCLNPSTVVIVIIIKIINIYN
jgi:hypothetical protein